MVHTLRYSTREYVVVPASTIVIIDLPLREKRGVYKIDRRTFFLYKPSQFAARPTQDVKLGGSLSPLKKNYRKSMSLRENRFQTI
jgi:hypothetical protein